ncbi:MAG: nucleoside phosphorylase [Desulfobacterales bacterium]|nr:nucleoside phosphorylase [Desulfobacterales bacterium]
MEVIKNDAIVNPVKGKNAPTIKPRAMMVANEMDLQLLYRKTALRADDSRRLFMSRLWIGNDCPDDFSIVGPLMGAPYAVMILETLIAWGARKIIFFGWCGAISSQVKIGDLIVPTCAYIDEGTSGHYCPTETDISLPSPHIVKKIKDVLRQKGHSFHQGAVWSTDAIFRETRNQVEYFQGKNVLGVEMELSALFTVAKFRDVEVAGILVVSDELSTLKWRHGFKDDQFEKSRVKICEVLSSLCRKL